jgi:hypothetical protein
MGMLFTENAANSSLRVERSLSPPGTGRRLCRPVSRCIHNHPIAQ